MKKNLIEMRLNKIQEVSQELEKSKLKLEELQTGRQNILSVYCRKNGHNYILVSTKYCRSTDHYVYGQGFESIEEFRYRCTTCGMEKTREGSVYRSPDVYYYQEIIPSNIADVITNIDCEISIIRGYIYYLSHFNEMLCELFGHDADMISDDEDFKCRCCGAEMSYQGYINAHYDAKYKGVVDYYYDEFGKEHDTDIEESDIPSILSLSTFESYLKLNKREIEEYKEFKPAQHKLVKQPLLSKEVSDYNTHASSLAS